MRRKKGHRAVTNSDSINYYGSLYLLTKLSNIIRSQFRFFYVFPFLSRECRDFFNFDFYFGVNVRVLCVAGTEGGVTPGCLIMGNGLLVVDR